MDTLPHCLLEIPTAERWKGFLLLFILVLTLPGMHKFSWESWSQHLHPGHQVLPMLLWQH